MGMSVVLQNNFTVHFSRLALSVVTVMGVAIALSSVATAFSRPDCTQEELQYGMCFAKDMPSATRLTRTPAFKDEFRSVVWQASQALDKIEPSAKKVVVVDLDETLVNNIGYYEKYGRNWTPETWTQWISAPPKNRVKGYHRSVEFLLKKAKAKGFSIMFITGRPGAQAAYTFNQTSTIPWDAGFLKPMGGVKIKSVDFKSDIRNVLRKYGYEVVLQLGDQASDFDSPVLMSEGEYLLPNVMYTIY
jgi:HAD superfamily, subfamily IIIB (Acid phosphatase)